MDEKLGEMTYTIVELPDTKLRESLVTQMIEFQNLMDKELEHTQAHLRSKNAQTIVAPDHPPKGETDHITPVKPKVAAQVYRRQQEMAWQSYAFQMKPSKIRMVTKPRSAVKAAPVKVKVEPKDSKKEDNSRSKGSEEEDSARPADNAQKVSSPCSDEGARSISSMPSTTQVVEEPDMSPQSAEVAKVKGDLGGGASNTKPLLSFTPEACLIKHKRQSPLDTATKPLTETKLRGVHQKVSSQAIGRKNIRTIGMPGVAVPKPKSKAKRTSSNWYEDDDDFIVDDDEEDEPASGLEGKRRSKAPNHKLNKASGGGSAPKNRTREPAIHERNKRKRFGDDDAAPMKKLAVEGRNIASPKVCEALLVSKSLTCPRLAHSHLPANAPDAGRGKRLRRQR